MAALSPFPETFIPRGTSAGAVARILSASEPKLSHHFGGGVYTKMVSFRPGDILVQHKHNFDHLSVLARGVVELLVDGERSVLNAEAEPIVLTIAAGKHHGIKALTDGVWLCVHATDETDPEQIDHTLVSPETSDAEMAGMVEALR